MTPFGRLTPGMHGSLAQPPVEPDATGCRHAPVEVFGLWHCRFCERRLDEIWDGERWVLRVRLPSFSGEA